jgi:CheY-like chemotaxis protein
MTDRFVILSAKNNIEYRKIFEKNGYAVIEYADLLPSGINDIGGYGFSLIEEGSLDIANPDEKIILLSSRSLPVYISRGSPVIRTQMLGLGIADVIEDSTPDFVFKYISAFDMKPNMIGRVLIMENSAPYLQIIKNICSRFGYEVTTAENLKELFAEFERIDPDILMLNMAADGMDINTVVRRSYNDHQFREKPFLIYRNSCSDIFIHELVCGLNRITKCIYSIEEVLDYIYSLFYKQAFYSLVSAICSETNISDNQIYIGETAERLIRKHGPKIMDYSPSLAIEGINSIQNMASDLKRLTYIAKGLAWLRTQGPGLSIGGTAE